MVLRQQRLNNGLDEKIGGEEEVIYASIPVTITCVSTETEALTEKGQQS